MDLNQFLHNLHFDVESVRAVDVKVDWEDAPLPFKVYSEAEQLPLPRTSSDLSSLNTSSSANLDDLSNLLWYSYGLSQLTQNYVPAEESSFGADLIQSVRRFVPSGGALYPSELYVYLNTDDHLCGIYHYDVHCHGLSLLRRGNFAVCLRQATGGSWDFSDAAAVVFVSTMFWKNYFKYHDFSYRLQGIDAGAVLGQVTAVAERLNMSSAVQFQFLDAVLNHLLGLSSDLETVYAVVPLMRKQAGSVQVKLKEPDEKVDATELRGVLQPIDHAYQIKSKRIGDYPNITALNQAAMYKSTKDFCDVNVRASKSQPETRQYPVIRKEASSDESAKESVMDSVKVKLPAAPSLKYDFNKACRHRYSPGLDFRFGPVSVKELAVLLNEAASIMTCESDISCNRKHAGGKIQADHTIAVSHLALGVCVHAVSGIKDGSYIYDASSKELHLRREGDKRLRLQSGMSMQNVNLLQTPLCFHVLGSADHLQHVFGYRGHRIQHIEVGMVMQKLLLTASALGMNGHPLLDYDEALCNEIYNSDVLGKTTLIQIPIGHYRSAARLEAPLNS